MTNKLFRINAYSGFISIRVMDGIIELAKMINHEWASEGMSGYDVDEFIQAALTEKTAGEIKADPEFGGWYAYYEPEIKGQIQDSDMMKAQLWTIQAAKEILAYIPRRMREEADRLEVDLVEKYQDAIVSPELADQTNGKPWWNI